MVTLISISLLVLSFPSYFTIDSVLVKRKFVSKCSMSPMWRVIYSLPNDARNYDID